MTDDANQASAMYLVSSIQIIPVAWKEGVIVNKHRKSTTFAAIVQYE